MAKFYIIKIRTFAITSLEQAKQLVYCQYRKRSKVSSVCPCQRDGGPTLNTLDLLLSISAVVHQPFYISICISTQRAAYVAYLMMTSLKTKFVSKNKSFITLGFFFTFVNLMYVTHEENVNDVNKKQEPTNGGHQNL